jgi:predicted MFS family arabinose efflux permease
MRRLLFLAAAVVFVDTMFFAAVVPLLPGLSAEFGLSKSEAGILSGSYAAGTLIAAIPGGLLAARVGPRRTVLVGLSLMSITGIGFALSQNIVLLDASRFLQGVGGAFSWAGALAWLVRAAPRDRRGEMIGTAMAAAIAGVLAGPALGAAADAVGRGPMFAAVSLVGLGLIALTLSVEAPPREQTIVGGLSRAAGSTAVRYGMVLILVPGLLFGAIEVLVPLELDDLGAGSGAIAAVFLLAAGLEAIVAPVAGRISDRRGRLAPSAVGLAASIVAVVVISLPDSALILGVVVVVAAPWIGMLWSPAMAMLSDGAESSGVDQGLAFGIVNLGWGLGHTAGAIALPAVADASSNGVAYGVLAALTAGALVMLLVQREKISQAIAVTAPDSRGSTAG